jgi:hypothetical protein
MLEFYMYYDAGMIWNYVVAPPSLAITQGEPAKLSATSTGFGVRFFTNKYVSGNVMWTKVLTKPIAAEEIIHRGKLARVFFSLVLSF